MDLINTDFVADTNLDFDWTRIVFDVSSRHVAASFRKARAGPNSSVGPAASRI